MLYLKHKYDRPGSLSGGRYSEQNNTRKLSVHNKDSRPFSAGIDDFDLEPKKKKCC